MVNAHKVQSIVYNSSESLQYYFDDIFQRCRPHMKKIAQISYIFKNNRNSFINYINI